ncbi:MAG: hypothetical protein JXR58_07960 [Bacteroidales bacterium]|nr:hypothetical protein [Bacteroidales bacterium]
MKKMIKYLSLILFISLLHSCSKSDGISDNQTDFFIKFFGDSQNDVGYGLIQDSDEGYIIVGTTTKLTKETDVILIKTNKFGNQVWSKTFGDTLNDRGFFVQKTIDGGYIIAGTTIISDNKEDVLLIKTDYLGNTIWQKSFGNKSSEEGLCVKQTYDGGYIIAGYSDEANSGNGNPAGLDDILLIRTNQAGDSIWAKRYGGAFSETGIDVIEKDDKGFIVLGTTNSFSEPGQDGNNLILIETNESGLLTDKFTYGGTGSDNAASIVEIDNGYLIVGTSTDVSTNNTDIFCAKTGKDIHEVTWEKKFGGDKTEYCEKVVSISNGNYLILGATESFGEGRTDYYLVEIDNNGNEVRSATFGGTGDEKGNSIIESSFGGFAFVGSTLTEENSMITLIKINSDLELK